MDHALKGLFIKEWKMMKGFFVGQFIIGVILLFVFDGADLGSMTSTLISLMGLGFMVLPAYLLFSLNTEVNQMQLFLHNPQSIHKLLLVKFMNGLFYAFCFTFTLTLVATFIDLIWDSTIMSSSEVFIFLLYTIPQILITPLYATVLLLFYWTLHQIWKTYIGSISIIVIILLLAAGSGFMSVLRQTDMYATFTEWGRITVPSEQFHIISSMFVENDGMTAFIYLGTLVFYAIISVFIYLISAYLLDRKVEV